MQSAAVRTGCSCTTQGTERKTPTTKMRHDKETLLHDNNIKSMPGNKGSVKCSSHFYVNSSNAEA